MTVRILAIMGSGETSPTMVKTHRALLDRLGPPPVPAVLLDTPFGFQANASEIAARAVDYFRQSVGQEMEVAGFRGGESGGSLPYETMLEQLRVAKYVFSGPGSPTYALRQWRDSLIPQVLRDKLRDGGCVTFASAAAVTLGAVSVPVYEIYKVGEDPRWLDGLGLLAEAGLEAAVIPHYNNAEGGTHDTRFCYLGEERLARLEKEMPSSAFVLGVDEHTGLVLDLDAGTAEVVGLGVVTVRRLGRSSEIRAGATVTIADLAGFATSSPRMARTTGRDAAGVDLAPLARSPLLQSVADAEDVFAGALARRDVSAAVSAVLDLDAELQSWSADTLQSDEMDRAHAALRSMIVRLGRLAERGATDPADAVGPFVETLLAMRVDARTEERWADADAARDRLVALGVEVQDGPEGTTWRLLS